MSNPSRREFLGNVGQGMLIASLGSALAGELGAATSLFRIDRPNLVPPLGDLEVLIKLMQQMPVRELQAKLLAELKSGTKLETLVVAGALANARTFGGEDYQGYHAFMALMPAFEMAKLMPKGLAALPVFKVLYRNTARIRRAGRGRERLQPIEAVALRGTDKRKPKDLVDCARDMNMRAAEADFRQRCDADGLKQAYDELQWLVQDGLDVHRVVLPWRAWNMMQLAGEKHGHTLLRQSVRMCVAREKNRVRQRRPEPAIRSVLPKVLDEHKLSAKKLGSKKAEDAWILELSNIVFGPSREKAADAVGAALAEGFHPESVGEAISLAANRLLLHNPGDPNRRGGVHGASIGVHASDAANAWRHISRVTGTRNRAASLVVAAYHTAGQSQHVMKKALPYVESSKELEAKEPDKLLAETEACIKNRDQVGVCAAVHRYGELGHAPRGMIDLMLGYGVSEDGALHAEKYFLTAIEDFRTMRPAFRWRQLVALARVTASEYGEPAPGQKEARRLLKG